MLIGKISSTDSLVCGKNIHFKVIFSKVARSSSNLRIILPYPLLAGLFECFFMFWLDRNLTIKHALKSKQSTKGYKRIIREILRRSGYFHKSINLPFYSFINAYQILSTYLLFWPCYYHFGLMCLIKREEYKRLMKCNWLIIGEHQFLRIIAFIISASMEMDRYLCQSY